MYSACEPVFASSLLSLISPWGHSRGARCPRSPTRCPRPVAPPPPPRRHSAPTAPTPSPKTTPAKHRRHSEIKNTKSKLDLRQELLNLNLEHQDFDNWLGKKFEEADEENDPFDDRFTHDIPLQRSISLDRGIDIFNHLQAIGSDWTESSTNSTWTVNSEGKDSFVFEQYRSFEDIPTSPYRVRSRRASLGFDHAFSDRNIALAVLKDSYKGLGSSGNLSPQIKKLQKCFTYTGSFSDGKNSMENLQVKSKLRIEISDSTSSCSCPVSPQIKKMHSFTFKNSNSVESIDQNSNDFLEIRVPFYRSISVGSTNEAEKPRQRKSGVQGIFSRREETNLRKDVLLKQVEFKSCENIVRRQKSRRGSLESQPNIQNIRGSYKNVNFDGSVKDNLMKSGNVPKIIISKARDAKIVPDTSSYVCDCRICNDNADSFIRNALSKLFVKIMSCREYGRKFYWDENNNLNESEMYKCVVHVLKLMLGLWLRHLDHN